MRKALGKGEYDRVVEMLESTHRNLSWIADNFSTLKKEYPNEYIAVCDGQVIVSGASKKWVQERAEERVQEPNRITVKKIEPEKKALIL